MAKITKSELFAHLRGIPRSGNLADYERAKKVVIALSDAGLGDYFTLITWAAEYVRV